MFIIATLLTPIGIGLVFGLGTYLTTKGSEVKKKILVKDETTIVSSANFESKRNQYEFSEAPLNKLKKDYREEGFDILLHIPPFEDLTQTKHIIEYYSADKLTYSTIESVERKFGNIFKDHKISQSGIDRDIYDSFRTNIELENGAINLKPGEENVAEDTSSKLSIVIGMILGGVMGFIMYMVIFIYGGMVMRSVMEEKINRIVEVMISSVKPTQLMLGKVIGVGAVGLTQLAIWLIVIPIIFISIAKFMGAGGDPAQMQQIAEQMNTGTIPMEDLNEMNLSNAMREFGLLNWWLIIPVFVIFFFGGYFIYSSLFAAIGSAIGDDMGEGQQLMFPIIIPVIFALIMLQGVLENPNGGMAIFGSLFPLTSPIIMPARLAFNPPLWEVALSIVILVLSCLFFAWLAGRIYRVGILLYGKKVSFKELAKWIRYKA